MTLAPESPRRLLRMLGHTQGTRSATVCHWRCADQCADAHPARSTAPTFAEVAQAAVSRRSVLAGGIGALVVSGVAAAPAAAARKGSGPAIARPGTPLAFTPLSPAPTSDLDELTVPEGYDWTAIMAWGDPVVAGAPLFDFDAQSAEAQKAQFGYNCDYLTFIPLAGRNRALMVVNHEYTNDDLMFSGAPADEAERLERLRISMAAHGMSVVEVSRRGVRRPWEPVRDSRYNRRVHQETEFRLSGPAAGSSHLRTSQDPTGTKVYGTVNNCAGGTTPWGTVLSGEENFQGYFKRNAALDARNAVYGISSTGRGWDAVEARWNLENEPNEVNRFGWIVELDPSDPTSTPRKHTALGRFKHEGATVSIAADGRAVAVMGDDQGNEYLYKFISRERYREGDRAHNLTLLEEGDLYVARLEAAGDPASSYDGTGEWVPLVVDGASQVPGFTTEEVLIFTRAAADRVSPTPMDRPEDVERNPGNGFVYAALTNNRGRTTVDPANPRTSNRYGQVLEIQESDATDLLFTWSLVVVCGDPSDPTTYFSGYDKSQVSPISSPDNVAFDSAGNLWISTDGQGNLGLNDALHLVPVEGAERGHVQQFLAVPTGGETCGPVIDDESASVFVAVQHPGDVDGATPENPASTFPYGRTVYRADNVKGPRPAVVQVYRTA
ncbi:MAG: PhoX family protein [Actinomycetes bacterium]